MSEKKFGGHITSWNKWTLLDYGLTQEQIDKEFPNTLEYMIRGHLGKDYKNRNFDHSPIRTSVVVREYRDEVTGELFVETLNTVYHLVEE